MQSEVKTEPKVGDLTILPTGARVVALIIGLESYRPAEGNQIESVPFAKADAEAFKVTLEEVFAAHRPELVMLTDADATLATVVNEIKARIWGLDENDLFVFYYAGHGFHDESSNRLTVWDTSVTNIDGTTLSVEQDLLVPLRASRCQRVLAFIDACATRFKPLGRKVITPLEPGEFARLLRAATFNAVFLSCRAGEQSFPDAELQHGVWTYYLLEALGGERPTPLARAVTSRVRACRTTLGKRCRAISPATHASRGLRRHNSSSRQAERSPSVTSAMQ